MNRMRLPFLLLLALIIFLTLGRDPTEVEAADSPYDVESSVKSGWKNSYGGKGYLMESGRQLIYDIYSHKYTSGGYNIAYKDFGNGYQPYVRFQGWSIIFGHKRHTSTNHETYITAVNTANPAEVKIYGTMPYGNLSASEDLEYNKSASTSTSVYNECYYTATNRSNVDCNMTYSNVGFDAWLPINELYPDQTVSKKWKLYIVKRVDSHIVYTELNLPFEFSDLKMEGGTINLSSGIEAKTLVMNSYPVIRRSYARSSQSGYTMGYFSQGGSYRSVSSEETGTVVWFGVSSPHDGGATRYAASAYWTFGGDQAVLSFTPNAPPTHKANSMSATYLNGNDYWVQPGTDVNIYLKQYDLEGDNSRQYLRLYGSGEDVRRQHRFNESSLYNHYEVFANTSNVAINSAYRLENTQYGSVRWNATPYTHGHNYSVMYYYADAFGNTVGYGDTGMNLRVDGVAPTNISDTISGARHVTGSTYWAQSEDLLTVNIRQHDPDSGNNAVWLRTLNNSTDNRTWASGIVTRNTHNFHNASTALSTEISNANFTVNSVTRTESTAYGTTSWKVTPRAHDSIFNVQTYFRDNVDNESGTYFNIGAIRVDDVNPVVAYRNTADTANFTSNSPDNATNVSVRLKFSDADSGYQRSRYGWSTSSTTGPTSWSAWTTDADYTVTQNNPGGCYLWVQVYDNTDNLVTTKQGPFYAYMNQPPTAGITHSPATVYNNTNVTLYSNASDPDGDALTYQWAYQAPGTTKWVNFSTAANPSRVFNEKGQWDFRLTVSDGLETVYDYHTFNVVNRPPAGNISYSPTPVYNDTTIQFYSNSSDQDGDGLTYQWAYQTPGSTSWVNFSTAANPTRVFNQKGTWNVRLVVSDGITSITDIQAVPVVNRAPLASFTWNPSTVYNDTTVTFTNGSSDADRDGLTYQWAYQAPGSTTWVNFSTALNPARIFNQQGNWTIRLITSDGTATDTEIKTLVISNRAPVSDFTWSPSSIYTDTTVTFTNRTTDADGDPLTYQWAYQKPGTTTWTDFSTGQHPSSIFDEKGTWQILLTTLDGRTTHTATKPLTVLNTPPQVTLTYAPTTLYEGDTVMLTAVPTDIDGDAMTVILEESINGVWTELKRQTGVTSSQNVTHSFIVTPRQYTIRVRAIDPDNGVATQQVTFTPTALEIKGFVNHTPEWQAVHDEAGHEKNQFYAGEIFLTEALVTDYPIDSVTVTFSGKQIDGQELILRQNMAAAHPKYTATVHDDRMGDPETHLQEGLVYFLFTAKWSNGATKDVLVGVNIVDTMYGSYDFYRSN